MKKLLLTLISLIVVTAMAYSQRTVTGTVTSDGGELLIGANVIITGATIGTVTDLNGYYSLEVPDNTIEITFSYTGFEPMIVNIEGRSTVDVEMLEGVGLDIWPSPFTSSE